jgi:crotonobetainyl-CoA:carnitine CoA-transferase CaiB-like acyl-CoA transferase
MGDHMTGQMLAGAVSAALLSREKTGKGQHVSVPLVRVGVYMIGWDMMLSLRLNMPVLTYDRHHAINPIIDSYKAGDGKWFAHRQNATGPTSAAPSNHHLMEDERLRISDAPD